MTKPSKLTMSSPKGWTLSINFWKLSNDFQKCPRSPPKASHYMGYGIRWWERTLSLRCFHQQGSERDQNWWGTLGLRVSILDLLQDGKNPLNGLLFLQICKQSAQISFNTELCVTFSRKFLFNTYPLAATTVVGVPIQTFSLSNRYIVYNSRFLANNGYYSHHSLLRMLLQG